MGRVLFLIRILYYITVFFGGVLIVLMAGCSKKIHDASQPNEGTFKNFQAFEKTFIDPRDGQVYSYRLMGDGNEWMTQNLKFASPNASCFNKDTTACENFGRLYLWSEAQKVCPEGWRLPTDAEWDRMVSHYGRAFDSTLPEPTPDDLARATQAFEALTKNGFIQKMGGYQSYTGEFSNLGSRALFWTSTDIYDVPADNRLHAYFYLFNAEVGMLYRNAQVKLYKYSCRCIRDQKE